MSSRYTRVTVVAALAGIALCAPSRASAQLGELRPVNLGYEYYGPATYIPGVRVAFHTYRANITVPFSINETTYMLPTVSYQNVSPHVSGVDEDAGGALHNISLGALLIHKFSDKWFGIAGVTGGIASNLRADLSRSDFFVSGNVVGLYALTKQVSLGAGVAYDARTGTISPIPLGVISWEPIDTFAIRATLPVSTLVAWRPWRPLTLQLTATLDGQRYNLSEERNGGHTGALAYSLIKLGPGARLHFNKLIHLELLGGAVVARRFERFVDGHSIGSASMPPAPYVGFSLWLGGSGWQSDLPPPEPAGENR